MTENEITCTHCDSDYDGVHEYESRKLILKIRYKNKVKEFELNPWEL